MDDKLQPVGSANVMAEMPFADAVSARRKEIKEVAQRVLNIKFHSTLFMEGKELYPGQRTEITANIMLAYRHLEDAAMRLGKVLQANDGGVSVYDK